MTPHHELECHVKNIGVLPSRARSEGSDNQNVTVSVTSAELLKQTNCLWPQTLRTKVGIDLQQGCDYRMGGIVLCS